MWRGIKVLIVCYVSWLQRGNVFIPIVEAALYLGVEGGTDLRLVGQLSKAGSAV
jgi:hypothetical protein